MSAHLYILIYLNESINPGNDGLTDCMFVRFVLFLAPGKLTLNLIISKYYGQKISMI